MYLLASNIPLVFLRGQRVFTTGNRMGEQYGLRTNHSGSGTSGQAIDFGSEGGR
jgi:hypothetical protein